MSLEQEKIVTQLLLYGSVFYKRTLHGDHYEDEIIDPATIFISTNKDTQMTTPDFASLLSTPASDVKPPPLLPAGPYHATLVSREFKEFGQGDEKDKTVEYSCRITGPGEGIDPESLSGISVANRMLRGTVWLFSKGEDRRIGIINLAKACGISTDGTSVGQLIEELIGKSVTVDVIQTASKTEAGVLYNNIKKITGPTGE